MKRIKKEYEGLIITKNHMAVGKITFIPSEVMPHQYDNFIALGFAEMFEDVPEPLVYKGVEETKPKNKKTK